MVYVKQRLWNVLEFIKTLTIIVSSSGLYLMFFYTSVGSVFMEYGNKNFF